MSPSALWLALGMVVAGSQSAPSVRAQSGSTAQRPLVFEVSSIKRNTSGEPNSGINFSPSGRVAWTNITLRQLMGSAYFELDGQDIVGGPAWVNSERFDVVGQSPDALALRDRDGNPRGLFTMLRALLEDRFALKVHVESRQQPIYELTRTTDRPGAGLQRSDIDCGAVSDDLAAGRAPARGTPLPALGLTQMPPCSLAPEPARILAHGVSMSRLAGLLARYAGRAVVDRTGLAGNYDFTLEWAPDMNPATLDQPAAVPGTGASLFTALQEQLGLRLEGARDMMPVIVIDRAEMPDPD